MMDIFEAAEVLNEVSTVLKRAVDQAATFPLHPALRLDGKESKEYPKGIVELWEGRGSTLPDDLSNHAWAVAYKWRCGLTFSKRSEHLIWLEDKVVQRTLMKQWPTGSAQPLPSQWFTVSEQSDAEAEAARLLEEGDPFVVKPRHAASAQGFALFRPPLNVESVSAAVREAFAVDCKPGETWQLYQVPRGVGIEPLYPSLGISTRQPDRPLELKVQVMWGHVVGASLHTSQLLWVLPSGQPHRWSKKDTHHRAMQKIYGALPEHAESLLRSLLCEHWKFIVSETEAIALRWGLDEVRVDWFLGCPILGPRICEVTWMGTADRIPRVLQLAIAEAFFAGHRLRLNLEEEGASLPVLPDENCYMC